MKYRTRVKPAPPPNLLEQADAYLKAVTDPAHVAIYHEAARHCAQLISGVEFRERMYGPGGEFENKPDPQNLREQFTRADEVQFICGMGALKGVTDALGLADDAVWLLADHGQLPQLVELIKRHLGWTDDEDVVEAAVSG